MKPLEQKQIALLERIRNEKWREDWLPVQITHSFMDEVWGWMNQDGNDFGLIRVKYNEALFAEFYKCSKPVYQDHLPYAVTAHLSADQKFEAACKALGIE